jgi:hypothetical protein
LVDDGLRSAAISMSFSHDPINVLMKFAVDFLTDVVKGIVQCPVDCLLTLAKPFCERDVLDTTETFSTAAKNSSHLSVGIKRKRTLKHAEQSTKRA